MWRSMCAPKLGSDVAVLQPRLKFRNRGYVELFVNAFHPLGIEQRVLAQRRSRGSDLFSQFLQLLESAASFDDFTNGAADPLADSGNGGQIRVRPDEFIDTLRHCRDCFRRAPVGFDLKRIFLLYGKKLSKAEKHLCNVSVT